MSSSRRSSKQLDTSSEFFLECKAAFLAIYDDIGDKIESKKRLNIVLQQSGRNPSRTALDKYWTRDTEELSFNDFVDICRKEPVTTADDLMKAFRKIDINGDGYISLEELYKIMNAQGEQMTRDDVRKIIDEVDENKDGRLDYSEFTNMVMKTTEESKKFSMKVMEKKERKKKRAEKLRSTASNRDPGVLLSQSDKPDILTAETKRETKQEENQPQQASDTVSNTEPDQTVENTKLNSPHSSVEEWVNSLPPEVCKAPSDITEGAGENDSTNLTSKTEFGSKMSLKSKDQFGSKTSLKSTKDLGSKVSLKPKEVDSLNVESEGAGGEKMGSQVSLRSAKQKTGSQVTLRSVKEPMGSQASLKSVKDNFGPQASVRSIKEQMGSQASVRSVKEQMGSQASVRSVKGANLAMEPSGEPSSALDSPADPQPEPIARGEQTGQESAKKESPKASPRSGSPKVSPRSPKVSPRSRTDSASKPKSDKPTPREKVTPRRESSSKNDKPPLPESPKSKDKACDKQETPKTEKLETTAAGNSARTVGEEISYDDDFDIISTGRPTPRVDLNSTRSEDKLKDSKSKDDKLKEETKGAKDDKTEKSKENSQAVKKGNEHDKPVDSYAPVSSSKVAGTDPAEAKAALKSEMTKGTEEKGGKTMSRDEKEGNKYLKDQKDDDKKSLKDEKVGGKEPTKDEKKTEDREQTKSSDKSDLKPGKTGQKPDTEKEDHGGSETARSTTSSFVDDIFKSSRRTRSVLSHGFELLSADSYEDEKNSKNGKPPERGDSTPKPPPRKSQKDGKKDGLEDTLSKSSLPERLNENGLGSQLSVRSDENIAPTPSPRKSVSRLSEGDVPKPSPRVTKGKGRSSSVASKDAMPDPKSLRDWSHSTSKGCFFYEEDEIVTHVYSLKLAEDSMVYLSAYPIQEPACLNLPGTEPVDTALFIFDSRGKLVTCTEDRDTKGTYGVKCELSAGQYEILPYTTGCRFRQRGEEGQHNIKESKLVKTKDDKVVITTAFRKALEDIFDLCDLDNNGTMSRDEFNWFNLRTSGEELGEDEWEVVEEKTALENGEITKKGFIELNEMEAEDAAGDVEDLWITLTSMGMNKGLIMDEACPFRVDVYVESARKTPRLKVTGIESIEKKEYRSEICQYIIEKADEPVKIRSMKDLYKYTYKTDLKASVVIDNRSRSSVNLEVDCSKSKNAISNRPELKHTVEINPQDVIIAHHLMPKSELSDWTVTSTEEILK